MKIILFYLLLISSVFVVSAENKTTFDTQYAIAQMQALVFTKASLFDKFSVGQSWKSNASKINEIAVFIFGPKNEATEGKIILSIRKTWHGKILASTSYDANKIPLQGKWIRFRFKSSVSIIPKEKYYLRLDCNLPGKNRCRVGLAYDYFYELYPQGDLISCWMRGKIKSHPKDLAFKLYTQPAPKNPTGTKQKMLLMNVDYGDNFNLKWAGPNGFGGNKNKKPQQEIYDALKEIKENGFSGVLWRISNMGRVMYHSKIRDVFSKEDVKNKYQKNMLAAIEKCDPLREAVKACRKLNLRIYVWMTINDSGGTKKGKYAAFLQKNPQYQWVSQDGTKYLQGVPCYAYPEVRKHRLAQINELMGYGIDGLFMSTRSHTTGFNYKTLTSFGFNKPIVMAFKAKYGIDIIKDFTPSRDALKLIKLRGNMMNKFYREVKKLRDRKYPKVKLAADLSHVPQNWPLWVKENLVDYLMVNSVSGNYGIIPKKNEYRDIPNLYVDAVKKIGGKTQVLMWIQVVNYKARTYHAKDQIYNDLYWLGKSKCAGGVLHEHCNLIKEPQNFWPYLKKALKETWNK